MTDNLVAYFLPLLLSLLLVAVCYFLSSFRAPNIKFHHFIVPSSPEAFLARVPDKCVLLGLQSPPPILGATRVLARHS